MNKTQHAIVLQLTKLFAGVDGFSAEVTKFGGKSIYLTLRVKPLGTSWLALADDRTVSVKIGVRGALECITDLYFMSKDDPTMKSWSTSKVFHHIDFWARNAKRVSDLIDGGRPTRSPLEWAA